MKELKDELRFYRSVFEKELTGNILPFWINKGVRPDHSGFYGAVTIEGDPVPDALQSCVLNARILWTFSAAVQIYDQKTYKDLASLALEVISQKFADREYGGYFMELDDRFNVVNDIKHSYVQAFVIYSLCRYYEYNPSESMLKQIRDLFYLFEENCKDPDHPGYYEAFTRDWKLYEHNRMADHNEPKSMNTHLHVLEAYAALYKIWKHNDIKVRLTELIDLFINKILRPSGHLGIFFDVNLNETADSRGICSFGHDIEASWLMYEAAEILGDELITSRINETTLLMVDAVEKAGIDKNGGLFLESSRYGSHIRTNKHWWLQAETLVGFMNAYQLSGDEKYWDQVKRTWDFIDNHVIDKKHGEWYTKVNRFGVPFLSEPEGDPSPYYRNDRKIDPWKCPYHNSRAMLELMQRIDKLLTL